MTSGVNSTAFFMQPKFIKTHLLFINQLTMKKNIFLILLLPFIVFSSCDEEESLSKKELIAKKWTLDIISDAGNLNPQQALFIMGSSFDFKSDGTIAISYTQVSGSIDGSWRFNDDETKLILTFEDYDVYYDLEKLEKLHLWISVTSGGETYIQKFIPSIL